LLDHALPHIRVIDLTHYIAGPYCTKLMAGFGAEVIKIERPDSGDRMRSTGPFCKNVEGIEKSIPFLWLNTGKKSITLDLKTEKGIEIFKKLVCKADAVIENFAPGVMNRLGLDYETLSEINPRMVMTSISNFGKTEPYKDYQADDIQLYALSGGMYLTGDPDDTPLNSGPAVCQYSAGQHAYIATLMALYQREFTGEGQLIDVSIQECAIENIEIAMATELQSGQIAKRGPHLGVPWALYECRDGYVQIIAMPARHWHRAAEIFEVPELFDRKFDHMRDRLPHRREYEEVLKQCLKTKNKETLFHAGQSRKLAFGYLADLDDVLESPQHEKRNFFEEIDHPVAGKNLYCGAPFKMSKTPWQSGRAPLLGEHKEAILGDVLGNTAGEIHNLEPVGDHTKSEFPLAGLRVIDLSHSWAAPHCARILGDYGAEVIKVEYARRLCLIRGTRTDDKIYDRHPGWLQVNRNKLSITLDLANDQDCRILRDLVEIADVFIENSRPGVLDKFGLGYQDLVKIKPELIVLSMTAFGSSGPFADYAGYGAVFEAVGGIQSLTAYEPDGKPMRIREMDVTNGLAGACAVMTALMHRQRTGEGQYIDLSQLETSIHASIGEHLLEKVVNGQQSLPRGNRHRKYAPQGCYRCKGDDKWVAITVRSDEEWQRFCEVLGHSEWISDPRFTTRHQRHKHHDQLDRLIEDWTVGMRHDGAMHRLQNAGIASAAVFNTAEIHDNPHLKQRGYFTTDAEGTDKLFMGVPFKLSKATGQVRQGGPGLGQHNEYVFCKLLGRSRHTVIPVKEDQIGTAFDVE
jgi:crotonobetainyl-CoA:carnitine CoA-transferase CaiB-like acyl-CoA transferase